jgi:hypothetical protein
MKKNSPDFGYFGTGFAVPRSIAAGAIMALMTCALMLCFAVGGIFLFLERVEKIIPRITRTAYDIRTGDIMIKEKTVFILGAGASCPYGYPDGQKLGEEICSSFVSDGINYYNSQGEHERHIYEISMKHKAEQFVEKFEHSSTKSIDLFLARNPEFMLEGKEAIVFRIFAAERASVFRRKMANRNHDWYTYLFQKLTDEIVKKEDYIHLCDNDVSFITFNYDRSLEHFLYESLINAFNSIDKTKIIEQLNQLRIIHVFDQVAGLDWQDLPGDSPGRIKYRYPVERLSVVKLASNLKIIYEENNNPELEECYKLIGNAKRIFFLGFGYSKENLEILKIPEILNNEKNIYGTALNCTKNEIESIKEIYPKRPSFHPNNIFIENMDSLMLLREYL